MKLLAVNICNLNSLVGTQSIDFREEPLASAGLYAIVGPTGAGKSTILDAITLALYGRTERDTYGAEVMSHGTGECFAEVVFQTREGTFLSRWERRRARQRPDGNLQTAQLQLSRFDPAEGRFLLLPGDRLNEVKELVRDTIGLDYDQFVRSVMLTQGQFARFLASSTKERADILEKITGTAIYSRISEAAFERNKLARDTYDRLRENQRHLAPLPDADRQELEARRGELEASVAGMQDALKLLRGHAGRYEERSATEQKLSRQREVWSQARTNWDAIAEHRAVLERSLELADLREPLAALDRLLQELRETQEQARLRQRALESLVGDAEKRTDSVAESQQQLEAFLAGKPERLARFTEAAGLEAQLVVLRREASTEAPQRKAKTERVAELQESRRELQNSVDRHRAALAGHSVEEVVRRCRELEEALEALVHQRDHLFTWLAYLRKEEQLDWALQQNNHQGKALERLERERTAAQETLAAAEAEVRQRRGILQRLQQAKGVEHLRADLVEGEPCPLCGAVHHPAADLDPMAADAEIALASADLNRAEGLLTERRLEERTCGDAVVRTVTQQQETEQSIIELRKTLASEVPDGVRPAVSSAETEIELEGVKQSGTQTQTELRRYRQLRLAVDQLNQLEPRLSAICRELAEQEEALGTLKNRYAARTLEIQKLDGKLTRLIGSGTVESARARLGDEETALRKLLSDRQAGYEKAKAAVASAREMMTDRQQRIDTLSREQEGVSRGFEAASRSKGLTSVAEVRQALLPPETEKRYRAERDALHLHLHASQEALTTLTVHAEQSRRATADLPPQEEILRLIADRENELNEVNRALGAVNKELQQDDERRFSYGVLREELERADRERDRWSRLNDLIGQKDGVKFSRFAQTLTLQRLVAVGNRHLSRINERYRMRHRASADLGRENLELEIIDTFQNDNCRPMSTLSGGETFIVSLALALGLSELASGHTNIQSLFIDEGFGTLDDKILDDAVSALEQLQGQGKTIGLISHVKELQERIYCQIRLVPRGGGRSQLVVTPEAS